MSHTPTPWKVQDFRNDTQPTLITNDKGNIIAKTFSLGYPEAEFIVKCVNSHDDLLEAAKAALEQCESQLEDGQEWELVNQLRKAIKKAKGKS